MFETWTRKRYKMYTGASEPTRSSCNEARSKSRTRGFLGQILSVLRTLTMRRQSHLWLVVAVSVCASGIQNLRGAEPSAPEVSAVRGALRDPESAHGIEPYRQQWALIVGINYNQPERSANDRLTLPPLRNAENDARELYDLLLKNYGYDREHSVLLLGNEDTDTTRKANKSNIERELAKFLDPNQIHEDDSVLFFFAGHGLFAKDDGPGDRGVLCPSDVIVSNGRAIGSQIRLDSDLVRRLRDSCRARHRLVILDACYSGEVFNFGARPQGSTALRDQPVYYRQPALLALASCASSQQASDGTSGHSPFTGALLNALHQLPARESTADKAPIGTTRLFARMRARISLPHQQKPDLRCLDGDGEFYFFPTGVFSDVDTVTEFRLLQAMVPGEYDAWWFEEMPWFVPSIRHVALGLVEEKRSAVQAACVTRDEIRQLVNSVISELRKGKDTLAQMRVKHVHMLLSGENSREFRTIVEQVEQDLQAASKQGGSFKLEAPDLHLFAAIQHWLGKPEAKESYAEAIKAYADGADGPTSNHDDKALVALCHADFGQYLLNIQNPDAALEQFALAEGQYGVNAPAAFRVFVLGRAGESWLTMNRWGQANRVLEDACDVARDHDSGHALMASALRRRAWAEMKQARIGKGDETFAESNRILAQLAGVDNAAEQPSSLPTTDGLDLENVEHELRRVQSVFLKTSRAEPLIAYFHNLHGRAMAQRLEGNSDKAAELYRLISAGLFTSLTWIRQNGSEKWAGNVDERLLDRLLNTQERLADCNLFGDPTKRDLKEAADDYRRAIAICRPMPARLGRRDNIYATLLFKRALTLSAASPIQDLELAAAYARQAVEICAQLESRVTPVARILAEFVPPMVDALMANQTSPATRSGERLGRLRTAISENRVNRPNPSQEELELLLFAARTLLDLVPDDDRYALAEDSELLLGLCHQALTKQPSARFLRPYYDAVVRAKLRLNPKHVKDLLEVQWEATHAEPYHKDRSARPILAMYLLDDVCHLFLDVPCSTISRDFRLHNSPTVQMLREAAQNKDKRLSLPADLTRELLSLGPGTPGTAIALECRWIDEARDLELPAPPVPVYREVLLPGGETERRPLLPVGYSGSEGHGFPFILPPTIKIIERNAGESNATCAVPGGDGSVD